MAISTRRVDPSSWDDVAQVLGVNGASQGCWCTFWRLTNVESALKGPADNRAILNAAVTSGEPVGVLAYQDEEPAGWCSVAPRTAYKRIFRTKGMEPDHPDEPGVWSIVCVYVKKEHRGKGITAALLPAAAEFAREQGATIVEAYPVTDPATAKPTQLSAGTIDQYTAAGFTVHRKPSTGRRAVMRL